MLFYEYVSLFTNFIYAQAELIWETLFGSKTEVESVLIMLLILISH